MTLTLVKTVNLIQPNESSKNLKKKEMRKPTEHIIIILTEHTMFYQISNIKMKCLFQSFKKRFFKIK